MDVNVQKQCVKVFTAEGVINMQPLLVLTQDLSGVAQQDTLVQGIGDIRDDISTLAKQGTNPDANLSSTQTAAQGAALNSQIARGYIGTPQSGQADTLFGAIANITIDTSTIAKQGTNASATLTATQTAATNAYASAEAAKIGVVDGNDTAVGVAKEIRSEVGTGSDTAAETGTLFAVVKWVKDKVKSIFQLIGSPASGQPSTLFAAIAAGGGGGGDAQESTSQEILTKVNAIVNSHIYAGVSLDGYTFTAGFTPSLGDVLFNSPKLTMIYDEGVTSITKQIVFDANCSLQSFTMTNLVEVSWSQDYMFSQSLVSLVNLPKLEVLDVNQFLRGCSNLETISLPELKYIKKARPFYYCGNLKSVEIPKLYVSSPGTNPQYIVEGCTKLENITIGQNVDTSFSLSSWNPSAISSDPDAVSRILTNIRNNIAANLPDRTGLSALTITFSSTIKTMITNESGQATAAAFTNKNWTIA